jgi:hypothetical protein
VAPPNTYPFPRFRPLEVSRRRPPCMWDCSSRPASGNLHTSRLCRELRLLRQTSSRFAGRGAVHSINSRHH